VEVDVFIQSDSGASRVERLRVDGPMSIGRNMQSTVCLEGDLVSRTHAVIDVAAHGLRVEDRSSNGTLAGDILLRRRAAEVPYGTPIVVGNYTVVVNPAGQPVMAHGVRPASQPAMQPFQPPGSVALPRGANAPGARGPTTHAQPATLPAPNGAVPAWSPNGPGAQMQHGAVHTPAQHHPGMHHPGAHPPNGALQAHGGAPLPAVLPPPPGMPGHLQAKAPTLPPPAGPPDPGKAAQASNAQISEAEAFVSLRRDIHAKLLENLDLARVDAAKMDDPSMRPKVLTALRRIVKQLDARIPPDMDRDVLIGELSDEALGLGPLERFLADPTISEVMVVDPRTIYIEQKGKLIKADARFTDDERVRAVIERIVTPLGRRIDESSPLVDARLKDGSRVNAVIRPLALRGACITIRKFAKIPLTLENLITFGALTEQMMRFLMRSVIAKKNILISGGTGSGKTTLLNILSSAIPADERIVTIEDAAELQLRQPHVVSLETRPANMEGKGEYTIRDLVKNSLRMRPDRIVVGECRGGEALDMLQAMNTGHDGSMTTTHANSPNEALARVETLVLMAGVDLPSRAIREQIANSIHLIVQIARYADGTRRLNEISEVTGIEDGEIMTRPIFEYVRTGTGESQKVIGFHRATGYLPSYLDAFILQGLVKKGEPYL
jgi:pilus assembly protein CpaF